MSASDARPVPRKGTAFRHYFAFRADDGSLVTSWAGADSEVSIDGAGFADCTNEATEIGSSGVGYIDLTSPEMNGDAVLLKSTLTNGGALPLVVAFFPEEAGDYRVDAVRWAGGTIPEPAVAGVPVVDPHYAAGAPLFPTLQGAASGTSLTLAADEPVRVDGQLILLTGGTGAGQRFWCSGYDGGTRVATGFDYDDPTNALAVVPDDTTTYAVVDPVSVHALRGRAVGNPDSNGFFPANLAAINGDTGRVSTFATAVDAGLSTFNHATDTVTLAAATHTGAVIPTVTTTGGVSGNVSGSVGSVAGNVGGSVASIAAGGITSTSFAAAAITSTAIGGNAFTEAKFAANCITAVKIADGAITAAKLAADAITAAKVAADAVTKIQAGLATATALDDVPTNSELSMALGSLQTHGDATEAKQDAILAAIGNLHDFDPATDGVNLNPDQSAATIGTVNVLFGHTPQSGDVFRELPANFKDMIIDEEGTVFSNTGATVDEVALATAIVEELGLEVDANGWVTVGSVGGRTVSPATQAGGDGTTTIVLAASEPPGTTAWVGRRILFPGSGETGIVAAYDGENKTVTFSPALSQPLSTLGGLAYEDNGLATGAGGDATEAKQDAIIEHLESIKGPLFDASANSLHAIRNHGDATWRTAEGFSMFDPAVDSVNLSPDQSGVTIGIVNALTGHTPQSGDSFALVSGPSGLEAIKLDTGSIPQFPANFSLQAIDVNGRVTAGSVTDKAGYALASHGLDQILVEEGINARQALAPILAATAGSLSGAGTGTITIRGGNVSATRITATTDTLGNRNLVALTLPT